MDVAEIEDLFSGLGPVTIKGMFGGKGVYHRGTIIAVEVRGEIFLKGDAQSALAFEAAGSRRWTYEGKDGKVARLSYWSIPDEALDDPDHMTRWAQEAYAAALRAAGRKGARRRRQPPAGL